MTRSSTVSSPAKQRNANTSRTFVSRLTAPFVSKQRSPVEIEIRLDEPFRQYFCGDTVRGAVGLLTTRPTRITHLVIRLHGFVKVVNNVRLPGETIPYDENLLTSMRRRKGIEYFGNGFARLFEDEHILCGDGRVDSEYEFRFEFDLPSKGIPSSIDFEHGTISYLLTATLTRPTTISPTLTIHHKLNVTGTIDIAYINPPKPREVSLKTPSKQKKGKIRPKKRNSVNPTGRASKSSSVDGNSLSGLPSPQANEIPPQSPVPSTISTASTGGSTASVHNESQNTAIGDGIAGPEQKGPVVESVDMTTAKTELLQGGCLPGDTLQLRITVDHKKPVKTMQGIIITIFRQGRIDTHPDLPLGHSDRGGKSQYEDYYPKSRTGLGGLSLTSAGSSRVFRQDLAQTMMPLIIDPQTLGANIKTSIQMPDHVFPTITCVPGSMISFTYFVEIVIDLRGKPAGQDRFLPHLSITNLQQHSYGDPKISKIDSGEGISYYATPGFNCLITDQLRRTKDVVFTTAEVIVGTRDSTRSRGKRRMNSTDLDHSNVGLQVETDGDLPVDTGSPLLHHHQTPVQEDQPIFQNFSNRGRPDLQTPAFPLPDLDEPQDEKSRIRRAEERLLPSSPPQEDQPSTVAIVPAAPFAHDEEDFVHRYALRPPAPSYEEPSSNESHTDHRPSYQSLNSAPNPVQPTPEIPISQGNIPDLEPQALHAQGATSGDLQDPDTPHVPSTDSPNLESSEPRHGADSAPDPHQPLPSQPMEPDKNELERQRQEAQASSPDDIPPEENAAPVSSTASQPQYPAPSAPTLDEVEIPHTPDGHDGEDLPVYRR